MVPRYKELSVSELWGHVKDEPSINKFFPDYRDNDKPDRDYLLAILSTTVPDALQQLILESRESRSVGAYDEAENLIKITPEIKQSILETKPQRSK